MEWMIIDTTVSVIYSYGRKEIALASTSEPDSGATKQQQTFHNAGSANALSSVFRHLLWFEDSRPV
jgi:hypothetical protein